MIGAAVAVICFWQFRFTEWTPARRVFSVANINDFSWRNRVAAWEGAILMIGERPMVGYGWSRAEQVYQKKYCPPNLENGAAIQTNDYFILAISAGIPALVCFLIYVSSSLKLPRSPICDPMVIETTLSHEQPIPTCGLSELRWMQTVCGACAIVLLVDFFFDGGLFKLTTGSVFWILLELAAR